MIYSGCLLVEEVFTDDAFVNWLDKQSDETLQKNTSDIIILFQQEKES